MRSSDADRFVDKSEALPKPQYLPSEAQTHASIDKKEIDGRLHQLMLAEVSLAEQLRLNEVLKCL